MIKLVTLLKEIEAEKNLSKQDKDKLEQARKLLATLDNVQEGTLSEDKITDVGNKLKKIGLSAALLALLAIPSSTSAQKKAIDIAKAGTTQTIGQKEVAMNPNDPADVKNVDSNYMKWVLGTSDDGILGQYTSQFKFPNARLETDNKIIQLGLEDNKTLDIISNFDKGKMNQWNKFVDWMVASKIDGKKISGNPELDKDSTIGMDVVRAYKETPAGKNFWVNDGDDIKEVQRYIKAYRDYTIASWKAGAKNLKGNYPGINLRKL
jgi:hypothetical protein